MTVATECLSEHITALKDFSYQLVTISLRLIAEVLGLGAIPALHQYQRHGAVLEVGGGRPLRGPGVDSWAPVGTDRFAARFKFFLFNPDGSRRGSEGDLTAEGCVINVTATRFE